MSTRLLLATRNAGKLAELRRLLESAVPGVEVVGLAEVDEYPEAPETGATFAENALLKAREAVRWTGLPAVADDSGLAVDALNGMPGVLSARWSGRHGDDPANTALLQQVCERTDRPVVASGGVTTLDDLRALRELVPCGVEGAIIGSALYKGTMTLADALDVAGRPE